MKNPSNHVGKGHSVLNTSMIMKSVICLRAILELLIPRNTTTEYYYIIFS